MDCFISSFEGRADFVPKCSRTLFLLISACHGESGWQVCPMMAHSSLSAVVASSPSLPGAPPYCTVVPCPSLKYKMALPISCSRTCFSTKLSLAKATSLAFVNVLKDPQRMMFYHPYQSSVLQLHILVFSFCKSVICIENTFWWSS